MGCYDFFSQESGLRSNSTWDLVATRQLKYLLHITVIIIIIIAEQIDEDNMKKKEIIIIPSSERCILNETVPRNSKKQGHLTRTRNRVAWNSKEITRVCSVYLCRIRTHCIKYGESV